MVTSSLISEETPRPIILSPTQEDTSTVTITPQIGLRGCVIANGLRVRDYPSSDGITIGWLIKDDCLFFESRTQDNNWIKCISDDFKTLRCGWVASKYVKLIGDIEKLPAVTPEP